MARSGLLARLVVLVAAATLPAFGVLVLLTRDLGREQGRRHAAVVRAETHLVQRALSDDVDAAHALSFALSAAPSVRRHDTACSSLLTALTRGLPQYPVLVVLDADLQPLCADPPARATDPALLDLAREALAAGGFIVGHFLVVGGQPVLGFALPAPAILTGGGRGEVVLGGLGLAWLGRSLAGAAAGNTVTVLDAQGTVLAHEPDGAGWAGRSLPPGAEVPQPVPLAAVAPGQEAALSVLVSTAPNGGVPLAALRRSWLALFGFAALSLLAALLLARRYISRPAAALLAVARRWAEGDLAARAALGGDAGAEFEQIARAFNAMAERLGRQRAELEHLNALLEERVAERTRALSASNNRLQVEVAERELSEAQLRQAQKLQAVGELAGGLAHDFNNLLATVLGSIELLGRRLSGGDSRSRDLLAAATAAVERGSRLTARLMAFSRKQPLLPVPADLNAVLTGMTGLIGSTLGPRVRTEWRLAPGLWPVLVDPNQLEAAVLNLVLNARDALAAAPGSVTLATAVRLVPAPPVPDGREPRVPPGEYGVLVVTDTGSGMSPEVLARVFEPFFTTKGPGSGSGLGLSQVHGLAHQSGGGVAVESSEGEGTSVTLLLPRALLPAPQPAPPRVSKGVATLLLVDDEPDVRAVTAETLIEAGHRVLVAAGGAEALPLLERERIDMLLADYAMPGMTGVQVIAHARGLRPDLPVLLVTGYAELGGALDGLRPEQVLRKPFRASELLRRVNQALGRVDAPA